MNENSYGVRTLASGMIVSMLLWGPPAVSADCAPNEATAPTLEPSPEEANASWPQGSVNDEAVATVAAAAECLDSTLPGGGTETLGQYTPQCGTTGPLLYIDTFMGNGDSEISFYHNGRGLIVAGWRMSANTAANGMDRWWINYGVNDLSEQYDPDAWEGGSSEANTNACVWVGVIEGTYAMFAFDGGGIALGESTSEGCSATRSLETSGGIKGVVSIVDPKVEGGITKTIGQSYTCQETNQRFYDSEALLTNRQGTGVYHVPRCTIIVAQLCIPEVQVKDLPPVDT